MRIESTDYLGALSTVKVLKHHVSNIDLTNYLKKASTCKPPSTREGNHHSTFLDVLLSLIDFLEVCSNYKDRATFLKSL